MEFLGMKKMINGHGERSKAESNHQNGWVSVMVRQAHHVQSALMKPLLLPVFLLILVPFLGGAKGCEKKAAFTHIEVEADTDCSACHDDGRTRETPPPGHDPAWKRNHGKQIQRSGLKDNSICLVCHSESQCTSCHQQEEPANHTQFWRLRGHGVGVGMNRGQCFTCHRGADFCERCHAETQPMNHSAAWGAPTNLHCLNCHFPVESAGAQRCNACHRSTPSHSAVPSQPDNGLHVTGADCRGCHTPVGHPDSGASCTTCHQ